jgi:hypothetical protein
MNRQDTPLKTLKTRFGKSLFFSFLVPALLIASVFASGQISLMPEPDSPTVIFGYFQFYDAIDQAARADTSLRRSAAAAMGISEEDFGKVRAVVRSALTRTDELNRAEGAALATAASEGRTAVAISFREQREGVLLAAMKRLEQQLPPKSWTALHFYINNKYRRSVTTQPLSR